LQSISQKFIIGYGRNKIFGRSVMQTLIDDEKINKAIQEGEDSEVVGRDEIFQILDDKRSIASV
jgi:hypothetical protein